MKKIKIKTEYIKLDQLMKYAGLVDSGSIAKEEIKAGKVLFNGNTCLERGKKVRVGDKIIYKEEEIGVI